MIWRVPGLDPDAQNRPATHQHEIQVEQCGFVSSTACLSYFQVIVVSSQKEGGSGVFWAGEARPKHPTPRFIEKTLIVFVYVDLPPF